MFKGELLIKKGFHWRTFFLHWWTQPWPNMCNLPCLNVWYPLALLIYGCPKGPIMFLQWLFISFPPIGSPSTSPLGCLKPNEWCCYGLKAKTHLWQVCTHARNFGLHQGQRFHLQTCAQTLKAMVSCGNFNIVEPFDGYCFKHAFAKV